MHTSDPSTNARVAKSKIQLKFRFYTTIFVHNLNLLKKAKIKIYYLYSSGGSRIFKKGRNFEFSKKI